MDPAPEGHGAAPINGRCLCGAIGFAPNHAPLAARARWCRNGQPLSSAPARGLVHPDLPQRPGRIS